METETTTKVSRKALVELFQSPTFNFPNADKWSLSKLQLKAKKIPKLLTPETEIPEASRSLLESILASVEKNEVLEIYNDMASEKAAVPKDNKKKASKTEVKEKKKRKNPPVIGAGKGYRVMGHSSTGVIHWLASKGYDFEQTCKVLKYFKVFSKIKEANIKARLAVGRDKDRSKPAPITNEQAAQIKKLIKG